MKKKAITHEAANDVFANPTVNELEVGGTRLDNDIPDTAVVEGALRHGVTDDLTAQIDNHGALPTVDNKSVLVPRRGQGTAKMDISQQTPTQVNADRDYAEFCEPLPSSPTEPTQITTTDEPRTLNPDDTGAVNFGDLGEFGRPSSQVSEDGGFDNTRGEWRAPDDTSQLQSKDASTPYKGHSLAPETPALPKNPFGTKSNGAVPFGGTQLFGQTQMLSSAVKLASPTSSRPSPNMFLNSISPNIMETSPLKNRANVSSPTDIRTSSPTRLHEVPATIQKDKILTPVAEETPMPRRSQKDDLIPDSPTLKPPRPSSAGRQPMAHYEPMKESQERKSSGDGRDVHSVSDNDSDNAFQELDRRRRVERKRAQAAAEMDKVSFMRTQRRVSDEQAGRKRRKLGSGDAQTESLKGDAQGQPPVVRDSQKAITQSAEQPSAESTKATPGEAGQYADVQGERSDMSLAPEPLDEEMIPATSPPVRSSPAIYRRDAPSASEPELPVLRKSGSEQDQVDLDNSSLPPMRRATRRTYSRRGRNTRTQMTVVSSAEDADPVPVKHPEETVDGMGGSEDTIKAINAPPSSYSELPVPMGTRSRKNEQKTRTPRRSLNIINDLPTSSSLTTMSGTPLASSKTTPGTQDSHISERAESVNLASPNNSVRPSRRPGRNAGKSESPQPVTKAMRLSRRSLRIDSDSTDELQHSPSVPALSRSTHSKSARSFRASLASVSRTRRLFDGMAFALSFSENQAQRTKLETKITQFGGTILHEGFQELFEQSAATHSSTAEDDSTSPLRLTKAGLEFGFAAVIADSHSRKAKYMQALALGLPCLAPQWATTCLKRGELIDWTPYLLCAGASQVLGNAIRSRTLLPYSALEASLSHTIDTRDKFLDQERLLIVMDHRKSRKETKQQYLFLALAMGSSAVARATSTAQAGEAVREAERSGTPFSWIYVDSSTSSVEDVLSAAQESGKRKRKAIEPIGQALNVLTDELMIQSLILGRLVEPGEME